MALQPYLARAEEVRVQRLRARGRVVLADLELAPQRKPDYRGPTGVVS